MAENLRVGEEISPGLSPGIFNLFLFFQAAKPFLGKEGWRAASRSHRRLLQWLSEGSRFAAAVNFVGPKRENRLGGGILGLTSYFLCSRDFLYRPLLVPVHVGDSVREFL